MTNRGSQLLSVPVTDLDSQTAELVRTVHERREPVVLTRGGSRLAVVLSPEAFDALEAEAERLRLQRAVEEAEREVAEGKAVPNEEVSAELDRWVADED
jgi:prevent-host-death family protein